MNHPFKPNPIVLGKCAICARGLLDHGPFAQCEVCSSKTTCDLFMTILMCQSCQAKEAALQTELNKPEAIEQRITDSYKDITNRAGFFNARIEPIAQLKEIYELNGHSFADYHARIKAQIEHFARVLFETTLETPQDSISNLLIEFRAEVRTKLKEGDVSYSPPSKAPKVRIPGIKKSPLDKMAELLIASKAKENKVISKAEAIRMLQKELGLS